MSSEVERLVIRLIGDTSRFTRSITTAADVFESQVSRIERSARRAGQALTVGITIPVAAMGGVAVRQFARFDKAMVDATSIMSVTKEEMAAMQGKNPKPNNADVNAQEKATSEISKATAGVGVTPGQALKG